MDEAKLLKIKKFIMIEIIVLTVALILCRVWVFPILSQGSMTHVVVSLHIFMIGLTSTAFSLLAIAVRRLWSSHKIYVLIPVIFAVFGYLMQLVANNINF